MAKRRRRSSAASARDMAELASGHASARDRAEAGRRLKVKKRRSKRRKG